MGPRVVVAMSGGVDSSVAAALLLEAGYEVIGVMLRLWTEPAPPDDMQPAAGETTNRCCSLESMIDARAVADRLGFPFYVVDAEEPFRRHVVEFFIEQYTAGRTPNPCLVCNRSIRFGYLWEQARALGAGYLATGHYARIRRGSDGCLQLWRGADRAKDQSYVLSVLRPDDLARVLFPVGEYAKSQVRELAAERSLPTTSRAESQDLCFIADGDYRRFLTRWATESARPGPIIDSRGRRLGTHCGLPFYTVGQRSGLGISASGPLYVLELDSKRNTLVVGPASQRGRSWLRAEKVNWVSGHPPKACFAAQVQVRYRAVPVLGDVSTLPDGGLEVQFAEPVRDITPGQAVVFYDGEICLGVGTILDSSGAIEKRGTDVGAGSVA